MSDEQSSQLSVDAQFEALKEKAKLMGINPGNMGIDALRNAVNTKLAGNQPAQAEVKAVIAEPKSINEMTEQQIRDHLYAEHMKLVRCQIYNNNPSKSDMQGEIVTVGNKYLGTYRKMIPFGEATDNGYHIPLLVFEELKSRKYQQINVKKVNGKDEIIRKMVPEYTLVVLPLLTKEELGELAIKQSAAERLGA